MAGRKRKNRRFIKAQNKKDWKRSKKRKRQIQRGKETVLNLSSKRLTDTDFILLGKGLSFCPKTRNHDTIKLAEGTFNFSRRLRLKEYFYEKPDDDALGNKNSSEYKEMPFFNKRKSTFTPSAGRDTYLDFYIEAIHQEILNSLPKKSTTTVQRS